MSDKVEINLDISERASSYSKKLQEAMTLGEKGKFDIEKGKSEEIFASELPEGIDMKTVKTVQDASIDFGVAHADALATKALEAAKADEEADAFSFSSRVEGNRYDSTWTKKREGTAMGKPWVKHGTVTTDLVQGAGRRGGINNVVKYHASLAESVFNK